VCHAWYTAVSDVSLWTRLNLSLSSGVTRRVTDAFLLAVTAKARGALQALDVTDCDSITEATLLAVATANAGALRELRACGATNNRQSLLSVESVNVLLGAAPLLRLLAVDAECADVNDADVRQMLRNEGAFAPLRLRRFEADSPATAPVDVVALAADLAAHESLNDLSLSSMDLDTASLDAVVGAALARRLSAVTFLACALPPPTTFVAALARLLGGDALRKLKICNVVEVHMLDGPAGALLGNALRANDKLTWLCLLNYGIWIDAAAGAALVGALTAHRSLQYVDLRFNHVREHGAAAGAALGALIVANTPALHTLDVQVCALGDEGLRPLVDALAHNTHLRRLNITGNNASEDFARERLLPTVRANTSLTCLRTGLDFPAAHEAQALVAARAPR
jgi:hypothetical protein